MAETTETNTPPPTPPLPNAQDAEAEALRRQRWTIAVIAIATVIFIGVIVLAVWFLLQDGARTQNIRDIFIIFMALESLVIGAALVVLIVQVASLINLLNNEIKPILEATNETIANLRGTTQFLSENLVQPVVKLNSYVAGLQKMLEMFNMSKK